MPYRMLIVLLFVFALSAQAQDVPPPVTTPEVQFDSAADDVFRLLTVQQHLARRPDLSISARAWDAVPIQQRPVTLFVPTDTAWNTHFALLGILAEAWLADPAAMRPLLDYHRADAPLTPAVLTTALDDARYSVLQTPDDRLVINHSAMVLEVLLAEDGMIYLIDTVLTPPQDSPVVPPPQTTEEALLPASTVPPPVATAEVRFDDDGDSDDDNSGRGRGRGRGGDDDESDDD
jgi:hypothetical protein